MHDKKPRLDRAASSDFVVPFAIRANDEQRRRLRPEDAEKDGLYLCYACGTRVLWDTSKPKKKEKPGRPFFRHRHNANAACSPESALHIAAVHSLKVLAEEDQRHVRPLHFDVRCRGDGCSRMAGSVALPPWDKAVVNATIRTEPDGRILRPDLHLTRDGATALALEVCHAHPVDPDKAARSTYPWLEVDAGAVVDAFDCREKGEEVRLTARDGNVGALKDPRCPRCKAEDRPCRPRRADRRPVERFEKLVPGARRLRQDLQSWFQALKTNGASMRLAGHLCARCQTPMEYEVRGDLFDFIASPHCDSNGEWDLGLIRRDGRKRITALGVVVCRKKAYSGPHSPPLPLREGEPRMIAVPYDFAQSPERLQLVIHSLEPDAFNCPECQRRERAKKRAEERARERELKEAAEREEAEQFAREQREKAARLAKEEQERRQRDEEQRLVERQRWMSEASPLLGRLVHALELRQEELAARAAAEAARRATAEARLAAVRLANEQLNERDRVARAAYAAATTFDWQGWGRRIEAAQYEGDLDVIREEALRRHDGDLEAAQAAVEAVLDHLDQHPGLTSERLRQEWGSCLLSISNLRTRPSPERRQFERFVDECRPRRARTERIRSELKAWASCCRGDAFTLSPEEDQVVQALLSTRLGFGRVDNAPDFVRLLDRELLGVGLLADKGPLRRHLDTLAAIVVPQAL